jgi:hypothetical protein
MPSPSSIRRRNSSVQSPDVGGRLLVLEAHPVVRDRVARAAEQCPLHLDVVRVLVELGTHREQRDAVDVRVEERIELHEHARAAPAAASRRSR